MDQSEFQRLPCIIDSWILQCVFDVDFTTGLTLIEVAEGMTVDEIKAKTEAPFTVADNLKPMLL